VRGIASIAGVAVGLYAAKSAVLVAAQLRLGNSATRLLLHMALECWDDEENPMGAEPRRYYGPARAVRDRARLPRPVERNAGRVPGREARGA
jgi:hypothetical protein